MGFHKILKKHDRRLPNPCRAFYLARLHDQSWVRGDYSDVLVSMSRVYSRLRGDEEKEAVEDAKQDFVRSTRKYWVHTEDISAVKYTVLQHLPVFLQKTMEGETDSQLINSVYLDNYPMELYKGRLDKTPGAIALRFRWYGTGTPDVIFVERKTHRDSWTGEVSVKERFIIKESQVLPLLQGTFDLDGEIAKLKKKGKSEDDIREYTKLAKEVIQAINSKQLVPTMRTQYMRTAFQIPFDPTVRISLDTNLCMITERTSDTNAGRRWFRDPSQAVPLTEITRFPHAVLEIKLQLEDESKTPPWVIDLLHSGKLLEVHKFSKFIHGCAVLMTEEVRTVPYWIDDPTLVDSITRSGAGQLLENPAGANDIYQQLIPHNTKGEVKEEFKPRHIPTVETENDGLEGQGPCLDPSDFEAAYNWSGYDCTIDCFDYCGADWARSAPADHITFQKVEPKLIFAAERTFISWLHMAVMLSSISIGVLAFSGENSKYFVSSFRR
jgi:SPX domain protein involved in polyphosphate accumulation